LSQGTQSGLMSIRVLSEATEGVRMGFSGAEGIPGRFAGTKNGRVRARTSPAVTARQVAAEKGSFSGPCSLVSLPIAFGLE
jgi:hypothetical protein